MELAKRTQDLICCLRSSCVSRSVRKILYSCFSFAAANLARSSMTLVCSDDAKRAARSRRSACERTFENNEWSLTGNSAGAVLQVRLDPILVLVDDAALRTKGLSMSI